jgi:hypothetical protein
MNGFLEKVVETSDFNLKLNLNYFNILNDRVGFFRFLKLFRLLYLK